MADSAPADQGYVRALIAARCPELDGVDLAEALDLVPASLVGHMAVLLEAIEARLRAAELRLAER
jgi:hypothetical protein